jgi:hypothetical protein
MASALQVKSKKRREKRKLGQHLLCMVSALQVMRDQASPAGDAGSARGDAGSARGDAQLAQVLVQIKPIECIWLLYL